MTSTRGEDGAGADGPPPLAVAVVVALRALGDLAQLPAGVVDGRLEALLRASLAHRVRTNAGQDGHVPDPAIAVLTACAHLAAGGRGDAYLALRAARDLLPLGAATGPAARAATDTALEGLRRPAPRTATAAVTGRPHPGPAR